MTYFKVIAPNSIGIAKVRIIANSGSEKTIYDVELDIRNPNPFITNVVSTVIQPKQNWSIKYNPIGMANTNTGAIEISSIPPINLNKRLSYLITYPHGCVEQTTSSVSRNWYWINLPHCCRRKRLRLSEI
jgi:uncharacterized protein YfaS (alpha-2-macroglobulin family)